MKHKKLNGTMAPQFLYQTPYRQNNDFRTLCKGTTPLVVVFLSNFGHPISRAYLTAYLESISQLTDGRLACVVRSKAEVMAQRMGHAELPFTLICDDTEELYDYFEVRKTTSFFDWTFTAKRILKQAQQEGYEHNKHTPQLLPLTLMFDTTGEMIYAHYAHSLTDMPENCEAIQTICEKALEHGLFHGSDLY